MSEILGICITEPIKADNQLFAPIPYSSNSNAMSRRLPCGLNFISPPWLPLDVSVPFQLPGGEICSLLLPVLSLPDIPLLLLELGLERFTMQLNSVIRRFSCLLILIWDPVTLEFTHNAVDVITRFFGSLFYIGRGEGKSTHHHEMTSFRSISHLSISYLC